MDPMDARYGGLLTLWPAIFPTEAGQNVSPKKRPRSSTPRPKTVGLLPLFAITPGIAITTSWTASSFACPPSHPTLTATSPPTFQTAKADTAALIQPLLCHCPVETFNVQHNIPPIRFSWQEEPILFSVQSYFSHLCFAARVSAEG